MLDTGFNRETARLVHRDDYIDGIFTGEITKRDSIAKSI